MNQQLPQPAFTVSQLNQRARQLLEISFASVRVEGEISNLARPSSGHWYFTLKDANAQVRCAMFRSRTALLKFQPKEGDKVEVRAKVSLYENRGDYQLIVDAMKPAGEGALLLAFQKLKERLQLEGLFNPEFKQPLPSQVQRVGIVTSATGAAVHDILTVLKRRDPSIEISIYPTQVQGQAATSQVVDAIERANRDNLVDVLIVGRGGGSLEDLWCFNEEAVARAIFSSRLPIISAVGHEVDFSIADFVADVRAATPSAAAELVSQDRQVHIQKLKQLQQRLSFSLRRVLPALELQLNQYISRLKTPARLLQQRTQQVDQLEIRLQNAVKQQFKRHQQQLNMLGQALQQQYPQKRLQLHQQQLVQLHNRLERAQLQQLQIKKEQLQPIQPRLIQAINYQQQQLKNRLAAQVQVLHSLSPLQVLSRGYSITQTADGKVLHSAQDAQPGERLVTRLHQGWIESEVIASRNKLEVNK